MKVSLLGETETVATILVDNPKRANALTLAMWDELAAACRKVNETPAIRAVILRGAGERSFCAGADISEFLQLRSDPEAVIRYDQAIAGGLQAVRDIRAPVIAQIHGACVGGGMALALMTDLRLMESTGRIGIPAGKLGISYHPDWVRRLAEVIGTSRAADLLLTARMHPATTALDWGFATEVVEPQALAERAAALAASIARLAPLSLAASKAALKTGPRACSADELSAYARACNESADYRRGVEAYLAGEPAIFEGN